MLSELSQHLPQLVAPVEFAQGRFVRLARRQVVVVRGQLDVLSNRRQLAGQLQLFDVFAEALSDLAADISCIFDDVLGGRILVEPFCGGLGADARYPGYVVRTVADQREVIDNLLGEYVELVLDAVAIEHLAGHRVDERDLVAHELRHVLVAGRYEYLQPLFGAAAAQGADDVVCFHAFDAQQRQAHGRDGLDQRFDLFAQVVRHRWPVRLVLGIHFIAERLAGRVEHDGDVPGGFLADELADH